jgi:hypothetical protein
MTLNGSIDNTKEHNTQCPAKHGAFILGIDIYGKTPIISI